MGECYCESYHNFVCLNCRSVAQQAVKSAAPYEDRFPARIWVERTSYGSLLATGHPLTDGTETMEYVLAERPIR